MKNRDLKIFTDGGCEPNPGKGGWGFVVYSGDGKEVHSEFGGQGVAPEYIFKLHV